MPRTSPSELPDLLDEPTIVARLPARYAKDMLALYRQWHALGGGEAPARDTIDPLSMPRLLPVLAIMEMAPEANDWRYALVGEEVRQMIGGSVKGRLLGDVLAKDAEDARRVRSLYDETIRLGQPTISFGRHTVGFKTYREFGRLLFPYRDRSSALTTLLLLLVYL
jgi:hypothetical protein